MLHWSLLARVLLSSNQTDNDQSSISNSKIWNVKETHTLNIWMLRNVLTSNHYKQIRLQ